MIDKEVYYAHIIFTSFLCAAASTGIGVRLQFERRETIRQSEDGLVQTVCQHKGFTY